MKNELKFASVLHLKITKVYYVIIYYDFIERLVIRYNCSRKFLLIDY